MHVPGHVIDPRLEVAAALGAAAVVASVVRDARRAPERTGSTLLAEPHRASAQAATAGLVFALQMVNVPVLPGTSGHLLGGALATALVGPRRALLAISSVIAVQALLFADGGLQALGVNLLLIAVLPVAVATLARRRFGGPAGDMGWTALAVGAAAAPVVSAAAFSALYAAGGSSAPFSRVAAAMIGTHAAVAVAEVVITMAAVALIATARTRFRVTDVATVWSVAAVAAVGLSTAASSAPDGLTKVMGDLHVAIGGPGSILSAAPLAGYTVGGLDGLWSTSMAGALGLVATAAACTVLALASRSPLRTTRAPVAS